jgi:hypothetical protein
MKVKKAEKRENFYDESNIGGACMGGKFMTKKEEQETSIFIAKYKAGKIKVPTKKHLQKTIS